MSLKSLHHSFDTDLAKEFGVHEAILIHHFQHWITFNHRRGKNFKQGRTWTYQTRKDIQAHFPYLSDKEIRGAILRLVKRGILMTENFNKSKIDRTTWYAFVNEESYLKIVYDIPKGPMDIPKGPSNTRYLKTEEEEEKATPQEKTKAEKNYQAFVKRKGVNSILFPDKWKQADIAKQRKQRSNTIAAKSETKKVLSDNLLKARSFYGEAQEFPCRFKGIITIEEDGTLNLVDEKERHGTISPLQKDFDKMLECWRNK